MLRAKRDPKDQIVIWAETQLIHRMNVLLGKGNFTLKMVDPTIDTRQQRWGASYLLTINGETSLATFTCPDYQAAQPPSSFVWLVDYLTRQYELDGMLLTA